jgi:hypothetical protein
MKPPEATQVRDVLQIPVSKDRLRAMPADERALLILLGYAANQINAFQKLVIFSSNKDGNEAIEQKLSGAQTQMFARIVIGVLNEALRLVQQRFLGSPIGKEYIPRLDEKGKKSLDELRKFIGSNLLTKLRTNYIFHHPFESDITAAFEIAAADPAWDAEWNWYFSGSNYNSFYFLNEFVMLHGIMNAIGEPDLVSAQERIMQELKSVSEAMVEFIMSLTLAMWQKHFGDEMSAEVCVKTQQSPDIFEVWVPFFVRIPDPPADAD